MTELRRVGLTLGVLVITLGTVAGCPDRPIPEVERRPTHEPGGRIGSSIICKLQRSTPTWQPSTCPTSNEEDVPVRPGR